MSAKSFMLRVFILLCFSVLFIAGSHYLYNLVNAQNDRKSQFPILIYTNTLDETSEVIDFAQSLDAYTLHFIHSPEILQDLLIQRYRLDDYSTLTGDYTLPYQLEIFISPMSIEDFLTFTTKLTETFPTHTIYYNENIWREIDQNVYKSTISIYVMQAILLVAYILFQLLLRHLNISANKENINAMLSSGISHRKLYLKELKQNILYIIIALFIALAIDFAINYFALLSYLQADITLSPIYLNLKICTMLVISNILVVVLQKPLYK